MYPLKTFVKEILQDPFKRSWTLQGFGMLRTYLPDDIRLHVWDERYQVPNVSLVHDHPWHFESEIVVGSLRNTRYSKDPSGCGYPMMERTIRPGEGFEILSPDVPCHLKEHDPEYHGASQRYSQQADEIHSTLYIRGTVTVVQRKRVGADVAKVYYPVGEEWVSGEPRTATAAEIKDICSYSLEKFFK